MPRGGRFPGRPRPPPARPPATRRRPRARPASAPATRGTGLDGLAVGLRSLPGRVGVGGRHTAGRAADHCHSTATSMPRVSQTRLRAVLDLAVHLAGWQVDEPGGELGEHRLELETVSQTFGGEPRLIGCGHIARVYRFGPRGTGGAALHTGSFTASRRPRGGAAGHSAFSCDGAFTPKTGRRSSPMAATGASSATSPACSHGTASRISTGLAGSRRPEAHHSGFAAAGEPCDVALVAGE